MRSGLAMAAALTLLASSVATAQSHPADPGPGGPPVGACDEPGPHGGPFFFERFVHPPSRLGVQLEDMTPELREFMHAPKEHGVLVVRVNDGSPAAKAGLRVGDVIVSVAGGAVDETPQLVHAVMSAEKDAKLALEVVRDGKKRAFDATLEGEPMPMLAGHPMPWMEGRMSAFREGLDRRMRELEERVKQLEAELHKTPPPSGDLDT